LGETPEKILLQKFYKFRKISFCFPQPVKIVENLGDWEYYLWKTYKTAVGGLLDRV
jgi:hypothetical protein